LKITIGRQTFYQLSNAFFWPVAIVLLALFAYSVLDLGSLIVAMLKRITQRTHRFKSTDASPSAAFA
jgi:hypothetical protein